MHVRHTYIYIYTSSAHLTCGRRHFACVSSMYAAQRTPDVPNIFPSSSYMHIQTAQQHQGLDPVLREIRSDRRSSVCFEKLLWTASLTTHKAWNVSNHNWWLCPNLLERLSSSVNTCTSYKRTRIAHIQWCGWMGVL